MTWSKWILGNLSIKAVWAKLYGFSFSSPSHKCGRLELCITSSCLWRALEMPREDVLSLVRDIFSASASRCRPANFIWSEWRIRAHLRDYSSCVLMNWGRCTTSNDEFCERKTTRSTLLDWCPCSCMRLFVHRRLPDHFSTLIPQLSSFQLSVRVKWKSEVLHFRSFSPFKEKGRTLFAVTLLDVCRDDGWNRYVSAKPVVSV